MANRVWFGVACTVMVFGCVCSGALLAQDLAKVAPKNSKVLLDNEQVRVMEVWLKPGESLPTHSHPGNVVYFITGGKTKTTFADGKVTETEHKADEAIWSDPVTHSNQNTGTALQKALVVELKAAK